MAELGLDGNLTASQGLGMAPAAPAPAPAPAAKSGGGFIQKLGLGIEAFGAGVQGRTPLALKLKEQELQQRRQNLLDMQSRLEIAQQVTNQVQSLPEAQRQPYLDALLIQYDDPQLKAMLQYSVSAPDILSGMATSVQKNPLIRSLAAKGELTNFAKTPAGQKFIQEESFPDFAKEWSGRAEEWQRWTRENQPDLYQRAMKDGKLTSGELVSVIDGLPENLKPSPASRSYFLSPDGLERLTGVIGIPVVSDKALQKQSEGDDATTLSKHLRELEAAEADLANATGDGKKTAQRRVDALRRKVQSESKSGGSDALKEMRNQIIMKTAKLKEQDPTYKPPQHEQYLLDEYNKADAIERLRREVLEGGGASLPRITSDEDYEKLPAGAEFIDPQGKRRTKP